MALPHRLDGNMPNSSKKRKAAELERGQTPHTSKPTKRRAKSKRRSHAPVDEIPFVTESPLADDHDGKDAFVGTEILASGFSFRYAVKPGAAWKEMRSYKNVKYAENTFSIGDVIYINKSWPPPKAPPDSASDDEVLAYDRKNFWVARIADTRAISATAVYLRIYWLYWPEELPMGRQPYHANNELVLSNAMDIVDAQTISSLAEVQQWDDSDVEAPIPDRFWRQTFNIGQLGDDRKGGLNLLKEHCVCQQPYNPEKNMYQCKESCCATWNHEECLINDAKERAHQLYSDDGLDQADVSKVKNEDSKEGLRFLSPFRDLGKFVQNKVLPAVSSPPGSNIKAEANGTTTSSNEASSPSRSISRPVKRISKPTQSVRKPGAGRLQISLVGSGHEEGPLLAKIEETTTSTVGKKKNKPDLTSRSWFINVNCLKCGKAMD